MWAEVWTLPELGSFAVLQSTIPGVPKVLDKHTGIGRGSVTIPADWDGITSILSSSAGSLIRVFRRNATGGRVCVFEFIPETMTTKYGEISTVTVSGPSIEAKLDQAALLTFDWPTNPSLEPDWRWGLSDDLLINGGFEVDAQSIVNVNLNGNLTTNGNLQEEVTLGLLMAGVSEQAEFAGVADLRG